MLNVNYCNRCTIFEFHTCGEIISFFRIFGKGEICHVFNSFEIFSTFDTDKSCSGFDTRPGLRRGLKHIQKFQAKLVL